MKTIAIIMSEMDTGGVSEALIEMMRRFDYSRFDVSLWVAHGIGAEQNRIDPRVRVRYWGSVDPRKELINQLKRGLFLKFCRSIFYRVLGRIYINCNDKHTFYCVRSLSDINAEIERENKIITDLLSLVKMDKTAGELNISSININELLEQILKRIKPIAAERHIELIFESYRAVMAEVDEVKLSLAVNNLIENAVKYNYDNGWVRVSLNADHKFFYIKVSDSGVGIPADEQENVFERFYRVDKARSRETGGTGLGLSITRNAILMHRGAIKIYSKEKEGTTFTVRIPLNYAG